MFKTLNVDYMFVYVFAQNTL